MNILVTGSQGFVGKRLAKALKAKGHSVKEFDIALGNEILNRGQCMQACKDIKVVYHLAAVLDEESKLLFEVNANGTENILQAAAKQRCSQFIYLSTVGVNAGVKGIIDEKSNFKPVTKYEKSKAKAEQLVLEFQEMLPITIVRSALVLGPNKYWRKITGLVAKGFPVIGGGKQVWQTIFIEDLVSALLFVLAKRSCLGETFVVAEQEKHSLRQLYEEIQNALGMPAETKTVPVWQAKLLAGLYSILGKKSIVSKAHIQRLTRERSYNTKKINSLGWKAKTGMKDAVRKTVQALGKA
jgi:nucleoside-diphosphate-sugar epimerase